MPQLETSTYLSQIFWLLISFLSLWFFMSMFVLPRLKEILEKRRQKIDGYIRKAEEINLAAQSSLEKYENVMQKAHESAKIQKSQNREALAQALVQKHREMLDSLHQTRADTEVMLAKEKSETLQDIDRISLELAADILLKLGIDNFEKQTLESYLKNKVVKHDV